MISDRPVKLVVIDRDPIFRLGLCSVLNATPECEVVWDGDNETDAWEFLRQSVRQENGYSVYILLLELGDARTQASLYGGIRFCQQLKNQYPQIPILVLSAVADPQIMAATKNAGVDGWCVKGSLVDEILTAIESILGGSGYWNGFAIANNDNTWLEIQPEQSSQTHLPSPTTIRQRLYQSGNNYINGSLRKLQTKLKVPGLPLLEKAVLVGRTRELFAAKWLLNRLFPSSEPPHTELTPNPNLPVLSTPLPPQIQSPRGLQAELFAACASRIQQPLNNISDLALEIDILRTDKKRELLYLVLQTFANQLDELRASQLEPEAIAQISLTFIRDVWEKTAIAFFGKFARIQISDKLPHTPFSPQAPSTPQEIEISQFILNDINLVETEILAKIPRIDDLIKYLIYQTDWQMENEVYSATHPEAKSDAQIILENLLIQVANAVIQPLINRLADVENIKQNFYARQMLSSREIERFRNSLSWRYRFNKYFLEPKSIFESRYELFVFAPRGIAQTSVYAPRQSELAKMTGIPLFVTIGFELRDAIAPRLQSLISILGSAVVFILTQVVGRGLGLVARGILQGIGNAALPNGKNRKP